MDVAQQAFVLPGGNSVHSDASRSSIRGCIELLEMSPSAVRDGISVSGSLDQMLDGATFEPADDRNGTAPESALEQAEQVRLVQQLSSECLKNFASRWF